MDTSRAQEQSVVLWINNSVLQNSDERVVDRTDKSILSKSARAISSKPKKTIVIIFGAVMVLLALILGSSVGVVSTSIPVQEPLVKMVLRQELISIVSVIVALGEYFYFIRVQKLSAKEVYKVTKRRLTTGIFCGACFFLWIGGLVYASNNTIQSHAYIFNSFGGTFIVIGSILMGQKIHRLEVIGSVIALGGAFLTLLDENAQTTDGRKPSMTVNLIDLVASGFGALYFSLIPKLKQIGPLFFSIAINQISSMLFGVVLAWFFYPDAVLNPLNTANGIFSVFTNESFWWNLFLVGLLTGHFIAICYFVCSQIFSPLFVSSSLLIEPFVAQMLGVAFGLDLPPGFYTYFGTVVTISGLFMAMKGNQMQEEQGKPVDLAHSFSRSRAL